MVKSEVVQAPLYGCAMSSPPEDYCDKVRTAHHRMMMIMLLLLRILQVWCKSPNNRIFSYKDALELTGYDIIEETVRTRRLNVVGSSASHGRPQVHPREYIRRAGEAR